ncbi:transporter, major facilitator family protein [Besnoitia besnoiti]|uniref:Transporter, major facilitator family protein n=1 Tax=Besnoitia besnoiti TaxID=94643 RepID=A0A2A9M7H8_BESBE|nr:transporter, major facilitator family protein [Besnoitia besnoiti]PFH33889.1 transporter, major facilitator family protein [Besnoitia besnoiti]
MATRSDSGDTDAPEFAPPCTAPASPWGASETAPVLSHTETASSATRHNWNLYSSPPVLSPSAFAATNQLHAPPGLRSPRRPRGRSNRMAKTPAHACAADASSSPRRAEESESWRAEEQASSPARALAAAVSSPPPRASSAENSSEGSLAHAPWSLEGGEGRNVLTWRKKKSADEAGGGGRGNRSEGETDDERAQAKSARKERNFFFRILDRPGEEPLHVNVYLMLYFRIVNAVAYAARSAAIFDAYLHLRFGGNRAIGTLASFSGLVTIVVAPFAGIVADRFKARRSSFLRCAALFGFACIYVNWWAVSDDNFSLFVLSTFMWKGWYEFVTVCTESLFNDCIPAGRRSELYVVRRIVTTLANGVGPLFSFAVFVLEGNSWSLPVLHTVLHVGIILSLPQTFLLWVWRDVPVPLAGRARSVAVSAEKPREEPEKTRAQTGDDEARIGLIESADAQLEARPDDSLLSKPAARAEDAVRRAAVPWLVFVSHCVTFCGAGMTVKYFPLFFKSEYYFQPTQTCMLSSVYTLFIAFFTYVIQHFAALLGRPQASLLFTGMGICCLFLLSQLQYLPLVIIVYLLRGALQNASTPIDRSLLMDFIDSKHVGKWSAMQSIATMTWSLSAFIGGLIADKVSYRQTFVITGCVYVLAELIYLPLLWLVPAHLDLAGGPQLTRDKANHHEKSQKTLQAATHQSDASDGEPNCPA